MTDLNKSEGLLDNGGFKAMSVPEEVIKGLAETRKKFVPAEPSAEELTASGPPTPESLDQAHDQLLARLAPNILRIAKMPTEQQPDNIGGLAIAAYDEGFRAATALNNQKIN